MATKKKLLQAAAGNAGGAGAALNVEDVFSTYLYTGTGASQTVVNGIELGTSNAGGSGQFASGEYLQRSSDFTSNSDGKTFTLSAWVFWEGQAVDILRFGSSRLKLVENFFECVLYNSGGSKIIDQNISLTSLSPSMSNRENSWVHILLSLDVNSGSGQLYVSDTAVSWSVSITNNSDIDFTRSTHYMHGNSATGKSNFSSVYLDYTYRNLATESNRRIFIDSSGYAVSGLESNNPIIYMPFSPDYEITKNLGTGGDFSIGSGNPKITTDYGPFNDTSLGEGGLVWIKSRAHSYPHALFDTERGATKQLKSNSSAAERTLSTLLTSFNNNGFSLGSDSDVNGTYSTAKYASWTFRKAPKFFDVVTWTGDGTNNRKIPHNLGSEVGCYFVKQVDDSRGWSAYHRGVNGGTNPEQYIMVPSDTDAQNNVIYWNDTAPTSTEFTINSSTPINESGGTYIAYLWAHNDGDGEFGPDADQDIIKCGSFTTNANGDASIDLGFEPQWVLLKRTDAAQSWWLADTMRGMTVGTTGTAYLFPDQSYAEDSTYTNYINPTSTGFGVDAFSGSASYIYIAIRRSTAVPESATDVFDVQTYTASTGTVRSRNFAPDMLLGKSRTLGDSGVVTDRLRGFLSSNSNSSPSLFPALANAETNQYPDEYNVNNNSFTDGGYYNNYSLVKYAWKRAPNYMDVVAYTGNSTAGRTVSHNLGVAPEMMWVKKRNEAGYWRVYHKGLNGGTNPEQYGLNLNETVAEYDDNLLWNDTAPTASVFSLGTQGNVNFSGSTYIAYLFASLDGISKVGSVSHTTGSNTDVDCGFSAGARFVILKGADIATGWLVFDSTRGIISGNSPTLTLNSTSAEDSSQDRLDPYSSGFSVGPDIGTGTWIYYAIA